MPHDPEGPDEFAQLPGRAVAAQQHQPHAGGRDDAGVAGDEDASLPRRAPHQLCVIRGVVVGRVVPQRAQPSREAAEHDVTDKACRWRSPAG